MSTGPQVVETTAARWGTPPARGAQVLGVLQRAGKVKTGRRGVGAPLEPIDLFNFSIGMATVPYEPATKAAETVDRYARLVLDLRHSVKTTSQAEEGGWRVRRLDEFMDHLISPLERMAGLLPAGEEKWLAETFGGTMTALIDALGQAGSDDLRTKMRAGRLRVCLRLGPAPTAFISFADDPAGETHRQYTFAPPDVANSLFELPPPAGFSTYTVLEYEHIEVLADLWRTTLVRRGNLLPPPQEPPTTGAGSGVPGRKRTASSRRLSGAAAGTAVPERKSAEGAGTPSAPTGVQPRANAAGIHDNPENAPREREIQAGSDSALLVGHPGLSTRKGDDPDAESHPALAAAA
jgi:hypothetical protein